MPEGIHLNLDREVAVLTIDRPGAQNAMDIQTIANFGDIVAQIEANDAIAAIVLTGAGGVFCAGADLHEMANTNAAYKPWAGAAGPLSRRCAKPVIAAVEGFALAGGCELALACDLIVATETAEFGLPEATLGLVAGSGGLIRLPQRIPRQIALELAITGRRFTATDAYRWGLVNRLAAAGEALDDALQLAEEITANGPLAVQMTKRIISESATWPPDEVWDRQRPLVDSVLASNDAREGAVAFAERRPPRWTGT